MNLVITDSGLGGLSVCARLMQLLKDQSTSENTFHSGENIHITYVNAVPSNDRGYNTMTEKTEQLETFEKVLKNTNKLFSPNYIFVACGTLSVLLKDLKVQSNDMLKIEGIISVGLNQLLETLKDNPESTVLIFATPTTINAKTLQHELYKKGIAEKRIISQACPDLANQISNDPDGLKVADNIKHWVRQALLKLPVDSSHELIIYLGCTHYSYREKLFQTAFDNEGYKKLALVNPNLDAAQAIFKYILKYKGSSTIQPKEISLDFVTPYAIPEQETSTLSQLLNLVSVETSVAFKNATVCPELLAD